MFIRLFAEAEDFKVVKGDWTVVPYRENYFASTFAITFLSRMACLGAPEQVEKGKEAVAEQRVTIPHVEKVATLRSVEQVKVGYKIENGSLVVTLPLNLTDMLLADL